MKLGSAFVIISLVPILFPLPALAQGTLAPLANFTLRDENGDGKPDQIDATPDGSGFDGYLGKTASRQVDRVFVEFDMSLRPITWINTGFEFNNGIDGSGSPPGILEVSYYTGTGLPDPDTWAAPIARVAVIPNIKSDVGEHFVLDVSQIVQDFGNSGYLGFSFQLIDPAASNKSIDPRTINLIPVPEPPTAVFGFLFAGGLFLLRRIVFLAAAPAASRSHWISVSLAPSPHH